MINLCYVYFTTIKKEKNHLLSTNYGPGIVLGTGNTRVSKNRCNVCLHGVYRLMGDITQSPQ